MTLALIASLAVTSATTCTWGWASQYAPSVMDRVIHNRQSWQQIPQDLSGYDGFAAVLECSDIGKTVWVRPQRRGYWRKFLATDCAGKADGGYDWMVRNRVVIEMDYEMAVEWNTVGRGLKVLICRAD